MPHGDTVVFSADMSADEPGSNDGSERTEKSMGCMMFFYGIFQKPVFPIDPLIETSTR